MYWDRIEGTWNQLRGKARVQPGGGRGPHAPPADQDAGSPCQSYSAHQWGKRMQVDRSVSSFDEEGFEH